MCGIVAVLRPGGGALQRARVAVQALLHRGPDGEGTWDGGAVALGHTRLAVIAPRDGAQPIVSEDGRTVCAVNGEIYGHRALRARLEARGHRFRTRSDSEVLLHLYEEHGLDALSMLEGELAFVLWDGRRLVAGRDRYGARAVVWREAEGELWVASEAKALLALGSPRRWDEETLAYALAMQYVPADRTVFEGIRMVPPGSVLVADEAGPRVARWAPPLGPAPTPDPPADPVAAFRDTFRRAVAERLESDAPLCFHLSGGIDSAAVLGAARAITGARHDAFTVSFPGSDLDERSLAEASARHAQARLHIVEARPVDLLDALEAAAGAGEGLGVNGHYAAHYLMDRAIRQAGFRSILGGEGADELLAGYPHLRAGGDPRLRGLMLPGEAAPGLDGVRRRLGYVPTFLRAKAELGARLRTLAAMEVDAEARIEALVEGADPDHLAGLDPVEGALVLWTRIALGGYILPTLSDRMAGAFGLEARLPFLDARLLRLVRGLPRAWRIGDGVEKALLREAARGWVPEMVRTRRKQPFVAPCPILSGGPEARARVDEMLRPDRFGAHGIFDPDRIRARIAALEGADAGARAVWGPPLMLALTAHAIGRAHRLEAT